MALENNQTDNVPVVDLSALLAEPSQTVASAAIDFTDKDVREQYNKEDFGEPDKDDLEPENIQSDTIAEEAKLSTNYCKSEAKRIVRLVDKGLVMAIPPLYKSLVLEPDDDVRMREYHTYMKVQKSSGVTEVIDKDDEILDVFNRYERLNEMVNGIALTDDEKEDLIADLTEVLKLRQKSFFSPETSLLITVLVIVFARVEPVLSAKFKKMFS